MSTFALSGRDIPCDDGWDVVVVGAGPAGCAAALAAGRSGARVLLLEGSTALGGMSTMGLVPSWGPYSDRSKLIYGGIASEVLDFTKADNPDLAADRLDWIPIRHETMKRFYDDKMRDANVTVRLLTQLAGVETDGNGNVRALLVCDKHGLSACAGKVYVDGTGDGDLAAWAGAPFEKGSDEGELQPVTHCFTFVNVDMDAFFGGGYPQRETVMKLLEDDRFDEIRSPHLIATMEAPGVITFNAGHQWNVDNTEPTSVSEALRRGRRMAEQYRQGLAEHLPETFGKAVLLTSAPLLGIRETRRILGDYVLTADDYFARKSFDDEIGRNAYPIDIHYTPEEAKSGDVHVMEKYENFKPGESHGIPYRSLLPQKVSNVLITGRSISCDRLVQGSVRIMPACFVTGEAAGVAAALAAQNACSVREIDIQALRTTLRERGGILQ